MSIKQFTKWALGSLFAIAVLLFAASSAIAQTSNNGTDTSTNNSWPANTDGAYTVSLGTGQLISLNPQARSDQAMPNGEYAEGTDTVSLRARENKYQLFYGGSVSSIYTNSIGGVGPGATQDVVSTSINPYLAVFMPTRTGRYLVQYSTVVNPNDTASGGPQAYHTVSASAMGAFSERWYWTASSSGSYGSESARLQGPLSFLVIDSTPIVDTASTAVLQRANNVSFIENSVGVGWLKSRRDRIGLTVFETYTGINSDPANQTIGNHTNDLGTKLEYTRVMTPRVDVRTYGEADTVLNGPTCTTYGGGLGLGVRMSHSVVFDIAGGPQWSTANCGSPLSANFSASLVKNFGNQDRIYASVRRMFTTVAQLDSRWEDDASVGFAKGYRRLTFITDAGYLRGDGIGTTIPAYHGYYVAPRVRYKIINNLGFNAGYRSFHGAGGNLPSGNLSYAMVGLEWYPSPLHFR
ncbi:MAG TPA: hypothetical protein VFB79_10210 [Candidatus Angelobacter sp.]|nr:hypothetical protein [Candidatus Angelobacter sp.]